MQTPCHINIKILFDLVKSDLGTEVFSLSSRTSSNPINAISAEPHQLTVTIQIYSLL